MNVEKDIILSTESKEKRLVWYGHLNSMKRIDGERKFGSELLLDDKEEGDYEERRNKMLKMQC